MAIVTDADAARIAQRRHLGHLLAGGAYRDGANRIDARQVRFGRLPEDLFGNAGVIVHGVRVRHAGDGREAARHRGGGAGRHGLLVRLPRLAQVDVHVDEAGTDNEAGRQVDDGRTVDRKQIRADRGDDAVRHQDVGPAVDRLERIDDVPPSQEDRAIARRLVRRRHSSPPPSALPASR